MDTRASHAFVYIKAIYNENSAKLLINIHRRLIENSATVDDIRGQHHRKPHLLIYNLR